MMDWNELEERIKNCKKCELWKVRTNVVIGEGDKNARIVLVGEAPGFNEDLQGRPFVGAAGKFLNELLRIAGLKREEVYITNVVKCRPPKNRNPTDEEINACSPYLDTQLKLINPKIVVAMGSIALKYFAKKFGIKPLSVSKLHGTVKVVNSLSFNFKIFITFHPAAALYNPNVKKEIIEDWKKFRKLVAEAYGIKERKEVQAVIRVNNNFIVVKKRGEWRLVKGGIEKGETPEETLKRELEEELNIKNFEIEKKIDLTYAFKTANRLHEVDHIFLVKVNPDEEIKVDGKELEDFKIVPLQKAIEMLSWEEEKNVLKTLV